MGNHKINTRYAKSLFDLAIETNQLESVFIEMQLTDNVLRQSKDLQAALRSPIIPFPKKQAVVEEIFGKHLSTLTHSFIKLVLKKQRGIMLDTITAAFIDLYKKYHHIQVVQLISAQKVDDVNLEQIKSLLTNYLQCKIEIEEVENKNLIGGFRLFFDNNLYDASISNLFRQLKKEFQKNEYEKK